MPARALLVALALFAAKAAGSCTTDCGGTDHGRCVGRSCVCSSGWVGLDCTGRVYHPSVTDDDLTAARTVARGLEKNQSVGDGGAGERDEVRAGATAATPARQRCRRAP